MKTLLIPVDFSATSSNALKYATGFVADVDVSKIILLTTCYKSYYEQILPSADFVQISNEQIQAERVQVEQKLKQLTTDLKRQCSGDVEVQIVNSDHSLLRSIVDVIEDLKPDLLLLGSDGSNPSMESYIGELLISITKASPVPVLIIPLDARYQKITSTLIPCDFTKISRLAVIQSLDSPLAWLHPNLLILNIDLKQRPPSANPDDVNAIKASLAGYQYNIHYVENRNIVTGILDFADDNEVTMITALPGKYSFFASLTHNSTTEAITLNARHPVLILK
jgi:nucleotide-binding universal stress UspA family protein